MSVRVEAIRLAGGGGGRISHPLLEQALESLKHQPDPQWIVVALCRGARCGGDHELLRELAASYPEVVARTRWGLAHAPLANPEERTLARLLDDPDDVDAIEVLRTDAATAPDLHRLQGLLQAGERLGAVVALEWRY